MAIVFLHIPKTAGSTFHSILSKQYSIKKTITIKPNLVGKINQPLVSTFSYLNYCNEFISRNFNELIANYELIKGHFTWPKYDVNGVKYITFLREPIERVISNYKHIRKVYESSRNEEYLSLVEFIDGNVDLSVDNLQVRMLVNKLNQQEIIQVDDLYRAYEVLRKYFKVGLTEYFDKSVYSMKADFNWKRVFYTTKNVSSGNLSVTDDVLSVIKEKNQFDVKLYELVKKDWKDNRSSFGFNVFKLLNSLRLNVNDKVDW